MVRLNEWCLCPPLWSLMRSWITCTIGSESPCAVGTARYLVSLQVAVQVIHWFLLEPESELLVFLILRAQSLSPLAPKSLIWFSLKDWSILGPKVPSCFLYLPFYIRESLEMTLHFLVNDGFSVIITFCVFGDFFYRLQLHPWQHPSGF